MKLGDRYALIKFGSKVSYVDRRSLLSCGKGEMTELKFSLPSDNSEIIDLHFTDDEQIIQILAFDHDQEVLIVATWNMASNRELSMY